MTVQDNFTNAVAGMTLALQQSATDPADALRLLANLADFSPSTYTSTAAIGVSVSAMQRAAKNIFRRSTVIAMARAAALYQPASTEDAAIIRQQVCAVLDAEIQTAADNGEDATFIALRDLRAAVCKDMAIRATGLPTVIDIANAQPLPAPVIAQKQYRDPARAEELIIQSDAPHPAFMPTAFRALA